MKCPDEFRQLFEMRSSPKELPKKYPLLLQGDVSMNAYLVERGCLRLWYNDDGDDITVKFFLAGSIVSSLESFYQGVPSLFGLESVVPTTIRAFSKNDFDELYASSPEFRCQMLSVAVHCMSDYQDLFLNRIMRNPEDRYKALMASEPRLFDEVPQHYIASYLGITPVSLSRIRNKSQAR